MCKEDITNDRIVLKNEEGEERFEVTVGNVTVSKSGCLYMDRCKYSVYSCWLLNQNWQDWYYVFSFVGG